MDILIFIEKYFILFMVYAIGGWCIEEINCSIIEKKVVDRGFLIGPVCPIYGFGGLAMTIFLTKFIFNILNSFLPLFFTLAFAGTISILSYVLLLSTFNILDISSGVIFASPS